MSNVSAQRLQEVARIIENELPGLGFSLQVFPLEAKGEIQYISNASRDSMREALAALLAKWQRDRAGKNN